MKKNCKGIKKDGNKCTKPIFSGNYCWIHANQGKQNRVIVFVKTYKIVSSIIIFLSIIGSIIGGFDVISKYIQISNHLNIGFVSYDFNKMDNEYNKKILTSFSSEEIEFRLRDAISFDHNYTQVIHIGVSQSAYEVEECYEFAFDLYNFSKKTIKDIDITFDIRRLGASNYDDGIICEDTEYLWNDYRGKSTLNRKLLNTSKFSKIFYEISELPPDVYSLYFFPINLSNLRNNEYLEFELTGELISKKYSVRKNVVKVYIHLVKDLEKYSSKVTEINNRIVMNMISSRPWYYRLMSYAYFDWLPKSFYDNQFESLIIYNRDIIYSGVKTRLRFNPAEESCSFAFYPK